MQDASRGTRRSTVPWQMLYEARVLVFRRIAALRVSRCISTGVPSMAAIRAFSSATVVVGRTSSSMDMSAGVRTKTVIG